MDRFDAGGRVAEQVVEYEEVLEDGEQYMEEEEEGQYYEEYVHTEEAAIANPTTGQAPVYYQQVVQEKPSRPGGPLLSSIGNAGASSNYNKQRVVQPSFQHVPTRTIVGLPRQKPSLVYTHPSTNQAARREPGTNPFLPNFLHLFPSNRKPAKIRKMSTKKKPCNCNKSMCLKLYCDCFANGEFCLDCNCKDCHNNMEHQAERSRAIKASLERNPSAFKPKIGVAAKAAGKVVDMERLHQRGCHCKRSNCLKNYCECYEAKVPCTDRCKCQSCRNTEDDRHNKFKDKFSTTAGGLAQLAAAAAADTRGRSVSVDSDLEGSDGAAEAEEHKKRAHTNPKTQPWFYLTEDVIEATTMCLVSQAQEFEQSLGEEDLERGVLKEFGRCLEQIIESASSCLPQGHLQQEQKALAKAAGPSTSMAAQ